MNNKKILAVLLLATLGATATGLSYSFADDSSIDNIVKETRGKVELTDEQKAQREEIKLISDKVRAGEEITDDEQVLLDTIKSSHTKGMGGDRGTYEGKRGHGKVKLTDDEREAIEAMTDEQKEDFIADKKAEREVIKEEMKIIFDKVQAGEELSEDEQVKFDNMKGHKGGFNK